LPHEMLRLQRRASLRVKTPALLCHVPSAPGSTHTHALRVFDLTDNQVRSLRKRQVVYSLRAGKRAGAYWGIGSDIADYRLQDSLPCPVEKTRRLAAIPTRLKGLESGLQERLINWGYAICDAALRRHLDPALPAPAEFPYPSAERI